MGNEFDSPSMQPCTSSSLSSKRAVKLCQLFYNRSFCCHDKDARYNQECARAATNDLGPARDRRHYKHFSLINEIKVVYLTGSFLIVHIEVRYSPLY